MVPPKILQDICVSISSIICTMKGRPDVLERLTVDTVICVLSLRRLTALSTKRVAIRLHLRASVEFLVCKLDGGLGMFQRA